MTSMVDVPTPPLKVLIAEGPWTMKENWLHHGSMGEDVLGYDIVVHKCSWKKSWLLKFHNVSISMMMSDDPFCINCNEKVPNMFKTLWTLKNLDKIQDGAQYGKFVWGPSSFYLSGIMNSRPGQIIQYSVPALHKKKADWFYVPTKVKL